MMIYWAMSPPETIEVFDKLLTLRIPFNVRYRGGLILVGVKQHLEESVKDFMAEFTKAWEGVEDANY